MQGQKLIQIYTYAVYAFFTSLFTIGVYFISSVSLEEGITTPESSFAHTDAPHDAATILVAVTISAAPQSTANASDDDDPPAAVPAAMFLLGLLSCACGGGGRGSCGRGSCRCVR